MGDGRSYRDEELVAAVTASTSWRGVLRTLGLIGSSAAMIRSARHHADRLGLDYRVEDIYGVTPLTHEVCS